MGISREQALDCFASNDLIGIGMEADALRRRLHPEGVVSYVLDRTICRDGLRLAGDPASLPGESTEFEVSGIVLRGKLPAGQGIDQSEQLLREIKHRHPHAWLHGLSADDVLQLAGQSDIPLHDALPRLREAGLDSLAGDDAVILDDDFRRRIGMNSTSAEWLGVHRAAHRLEMPSTAAMRFGAGETIAQRVQHLQLLHQLQQETGGFTAFLPLSHRPGASRTQPAPEEPTSVEYLKTLAIARMVLDNIPNFEMSAPAQGLKVLQMGLRFGANDVGSATAEGVRAAGRAAFTTEEELRRLIRDAGFRPAERDTPYRTLFLN